MLHSTFLLSKFESFNLNLLECKCTPSDVPSTSRTVLISTYWNVNDRGILIDMPLVKVLISTYWNVNPKIR